MEDDELQDDQADGTGSDDGTQSGSDNSAPPAGEPPAKDDSKRISDLMSKWQAEEARANKLEAALAAATGGQPPAPQDDGAQGDAALDEFREFARENARNTLFSSNPQLAAAGLTAEDITGSTLAEMQASLAKHQKTISGLEGRLRNQILAEHGLSPEVATGAGTEKAPSFSTMTDKEFAEFLEKRAGGSF